MSMDPIEEDVISTTFTIQSSEEIINGSALHILSDETFKNGQIVPGGLVDLRMGAFDNYICQKCDKNRDVCQGHYGHIELNIPVYNCTFLNRVKDILDCICHKCSRLRVDWEKMIETEKRPKTRTLYANIRDCTHTVNPEKLLGIIKDLCKSGKLNKCPHTGCGQTNIPTLNRKGGYLFLPKIGEKRECFKAKTAYSILSEIRDDDVKRLGLNYRPEWLIMTVMRVMPTCARPSMMNGGRYCDDALTKKYGDIIKLNQKALGEIKVLSSSDTEFLEFSLQDEVNHFFSSKHYTQSPLYTGLKFGKGVKGPKRVLKPIKSLDTRISGKNGRLRKNLMGKRVDFCARTVITGDATLDLDEVGVPYSIAMELTFPESVTSYNMLRLTQMIQNGPSKYPGAKYLKVKPKNHLFADDTDMWPMFDLKYRKGGKRYEKAAGKTAELEKLKAKIERDDDNEIEEELEAHVVGAANDVVLNIGDIVERHMIDGDVVVFNRHPSLHKMSLMGHRVKIMKGDTFRMNLAATSSYNADFDGDEMNIHLAQSYQAQAEIRELMMVPKNIITPQASRPLMGIVQDGLIGLYLLTADETKIARSDAMNMYTAIKYPQQSFPSTIHEVTGKALFSCLFPKTFYYDNGDMKVIDGQLVTGRLNKKHIGSTHGNLLQVFFNDYKEKATSDFISDAQRLAHSFLLYHGFSVGLGDCLIDSDVEEDIKEKMENGLKHLKKEMPLTTSLSSTSIKEMESMRDLSDLSTKCGSIVNKALSADNNIAKMVTAGSKGSSMNITQVSACVGQQNIGGKRIQPTLEDRTLPCFSKFDKSPEALGFVQSPYHKGLNTSEFFFHAMGGREGVIDTAIKSIVGESDLFIRDGDRLRIVKIGDWIDELMAQNTKDVTLNKEDNNLEVLSLKDKAINITIPTIDNDGKFSWEDLTHVTRHDPSPQLYKVTTKSGRSIDVVESKTLLIFNSETKKFEAKLTSEVKVGEYMSVVEHVKIPNDAIVTNIDVEEWFPKNLYYWGTEVAKAQASFEARNSRFMRDWWKEHSGTTFILPYYSFPSYLRGMKNHGHKMLPNYIYSKNGKKNKYEFPDKFQLNRRNGQFIGLFIAEGNIDRCSICITTNDDDILDFVKSWFDDLGIHNYVERREVALGVTQSIKGASILYATLITKLVGKGAAGKYIPDVFHSAPEEFKVGLLDGYICGDGCVGKNDITSSTVSKRLHEGLMLLYSSLGIFSYGRINVPSPDKLNNLGTLNPKPTYALTVNSFWGSIFRNKITLMLTRKQDRLNAARFTEKHRNYPKFEDVILDAIKNIEPYDAKTNQKVYDVTVPKTLNFMVGNCLGLMDTATSGYITRKETKILENIKVCYDGTVRNAQNEIIQLQYGDDGLDPTKLEKQYIELFGASEEKIKYWANDSEEYLQQLKSAKDKLHFAFPDRPAAECGWYLPYNFHRFIKTSLVSDNENPATSACEILQCIKSLSANKQGFLLEALLLSELAPSHKFTISQVHQVCDFVELSYQRAKIASGESVGNIAAQSLGEPTMQMTLNTFHMAGTGNKTVSTGIPRLTEILDNSKKIKTPSMKLALHPPYCNDELLTKALSVTLRWQTLQDLMVSSQVCYLQSGRGVLEVDKEWFNIWKSIYADTYEYDWINDDYSNEAENSDEPCALTDAVIRYEIDITKILNRHVVEFEHVLCKTGHDIAQLIVSSIPGLHAMSSPAGVQPTVIYVRVLNEESINTTVKAKKSESSSLTIPNEIFSEYLRKELPSLIKVSGIDGVINTFVNKRNVSKVAGEIVNEYYIETEGTNLIGAMLVSQINIDKISCNEPSVTRAVFGVEAANKILYDEITEVMSNAAFVNPRHTQVLVNTMTFSGNILAVSRHGMNKLDNIGVIERASFEQGEKMLLEGALDNKNDMLKGVSAQIATGKLITSGSGFCDILVNEEMLQTIAEIEENDDDEEEWVAPF